MTRTHRMRASNGRPSSGEIATLQPANAAHSTGYVNNHIPDRITSTIRCAYASSRSLLVAQATIRLPVIPVGTSLSGISSTPAHASAHMPVGASGAPDPCTPVRRLARTPAGGG
jgi:hypothetical protein